MASFKAPGIYVQDIVNGSKNIEQMSSSVGILIGVTRNGLANVAQKITSWTEYILKYANGLDTPFISDDYLSYAVHGFFTNGGKELYIGSVKAEDASKAEITSTTNKITAVASTEGVWGNDIKIKLTKNADYDESAYKAFDITISIGSSDSVTINDVLITNIEGAVLSNSKAKQWLSVFSVGAGVSALAEEEFTLASGSDGTALVDADYVKALSMIDTLEDVTFVAIPGQTSSTVNEAILDYCDAHGLFPIIDMPMSSTADVTKTYRKKIKAWTGALTHPWGKVLDPLTNAPKAVPNAGHIMGVYARTVENYGIHKAPAGVDATVRGFIEMEYQLTPAEISTLNPLGVICVTSRPNTGIVIWGARSLNSTDTTMRYVSDGILNLNIKRFLHTETQFAVFEPNDETLWTRVEATCKAYLEALRTSGALKGTAEQAYFVTVNSTNNTEESIANGELNIEIGYAPVKPAEFVIVRLAHSIVSAE